MKVLVVGDLHFKVSNKLCEQFISALDCKGYDACILLGDVLHTHEKISESCMNMVIRLFYKITRQCHLYVIVGNHDYKDASQFLTSRHSLAAFKEWKNVTVVDYPTIVEICGKKFTMCPYVSPGRFREAIDVVDWKSTDMIFCHQEFFGVKMGAITSTTGDPWKSSYPRVVSGHIHDRQKLANGVYYPGVPYDHGYGYNGKRIVCVIDESLRITSIDLGLSRNRLLYMTLEEAEGLEVNENDNYKVVLSCTKTQYADFCKNHKHKNVTFTFNDTETVVNQTSFSKSISYRRVFDKLVAGEGSHVQKMYKEIVCKI